MACDHLHKRVFEDSMETLKDSYDRIWKLYDTTFQEILKAMGKAWVSKKGARLIDKLGKDIGENLELTATATYNNYNTMKDGATQYARDQEMHVSVSSISKRTYEKYNITCDTEDIDIYEEELDKAYEGLVKVLTEMRDTMQNALDVTASDETFGYYSTGQNPRAVIKTSYTLMYNNMEKYLNEFSGSFATQLEEDRATREANKQASMTSIF